MLAHLVSAPTLRMTVYSKLRPALRSTCRCGCSRPPFEEKDGSVTGIAHVAMVTALGRLTYSPDGDRATVQTHSVQWCQTTFPAFVDLVECHVRAVGGTMIHCPLFLPGVDETVVGNAVRGAPVFLTVVSVDDDEGEQDSECHCTEETYRPFHLHLEQVIVWFPAILPPRIMLSRPFPKFCP